MNKWYRPFLFGSALVLCSVFFYTMHYLVFRDPHHIFIFLFGDIAFVFIEVLLVTLIIHRLLDTQAKQTMLKKLNMVIGVFFSEVGTSLLQRFSHADTRIETIRPVLSDPETWSGNAFGRVRNTLRGAPYTMEIDRIDLAAFRNFLGERRTFLLGLLQNPNLLEHETFTNLLQGVFHLTEELVSRGSLDDLPPSDRKHLEGDMDRVYGLLVLQWFDYMKHLRVNYPFLFSLAVRTNPFNPQSNAVVR